MLQSVAESCSVFKNIVTPLLCVRVEDAVFLYRVANTHRMPHLYRSFCAKDHIIRISFPDRDVIDVY